MIDDPYKVLGVPRDATQDEIKKAYRKMAKLYHPDLHPDDPQANQKMNDVNTAYDMLMNPDKYAAQRARQSAYSNTSSAGSSSYGGSYSGSYGNPYGSSSQSGSGQYRRTTYDGDYGWTGDFFNWEDIFFGGAYQNAYTGSTKPQAESGDSEEIRNAISYINAGNYREAIVILTKIPSTGRNARWYYLSALANHGMGNSPRDVDMMQRAVQLDPNNQLYHSLLRQYRNRSSSSPYRTYTYTSGRGDSGGRSVLGIVSKIFISYIVIQFIFMILRLFLGFGFYF